MQMLEKQFEEQLIKNCELAEKQCDCKLKRMIENTKRFGGVKMVRELLKKGRTSDDFEKLESAHLLKLTMEALVIDTKYAELFTDDEVNMCYELLCEYGYFGA